jgi:tetratricopeptide (TPR) repeat protein
MRNQVIEHIDDQFSAVLREAVRLHREGDLAGARQACLKILGQDSACPDALHLLGVIAYQTGEIQEAVTLIRRATQLAPEQPLYHYNLGNVYLDKGLNDQAIYCYRRAIELDCNCAEAYFKLGVLENAAGSQSTAVDYYIRAAQLAPEMAEAWHNLGLIKKSQQDLDAAIFYFQKAIASDPDFALAYFSLGNVLRKQNKLNRATTCFRRALELEPGFCPAQTVLGEIHQESGNIDVAMQYYLKALKLKPDSVRLLNKIGSIYQSQKKVPQALDYLERAARLKPDYPDALFNLACVYEMGGDLKKAVEKYGKVLEIHPQSAETLYNMASLKARLGMLDDAISYVKQAIRIQPDHKESHSNLGNYLRAKGQIDKAIEQYRKAIDIDPYVPSVHLNLSITLLLSGRFEEGWPEYEWRMQVDGYRQDYKYFGSPLWDGGDFSGKRLLVHEDQGLGDTLQFVRYLPLVKKKGGTVIFEARPALAGLLKNIPGLDELIERPPEGRSDINFDYYIPLMSVAGRMKTQLETIPSDVPYLFADSKKSKDWRKKMRGPGYRIGIVWAGNKAHVNDANRSCSLDQFDWLAHIPQTSIFSLQKDLAAKELKQLQMLGIPNLGMQFCDFSDTAAAIENLDLVIVVDTAVAHLAAAMGKPTWILLPFDPDWRWLTVRSDSPWYPAVRLFRQRQPGDWDGVMAAVCNALKKRVHANRHAVSANH